MMSSSTRLVQIPQEWAETRTVAETRSSRGSRRKPEGECFLLSSLKIWIRPCPRHPKNCAFNTLWLIVRRILSLTARFARSGSNLQTNTTSYAHGMATTHRDIPGNDCVTDVKPLAMWPQNAHRLYESRTNAPQHEWATSKG